MSFTLEAGKVLAVVGKSGSGKTTLVKCLYGLEDLEGGEILLDGERITGPAFNLIPGHAGMKLVSQEFYVLENHTVEENIFDRLIGYSDAEKKRRAARMLRLLELTQLRNTRAKHLSTGQKQRVAVARALAELPKVLLLDEPFSNLDKLLSGKLFAYITREVRKQKTAVILVTHLGEEALKYADGIAIMDDGRFSQAGDKWKVYYRPRSIRLAGLLGDYNIIRKEDLEAGTGLKCRSKLFTRPDRLHLTMKVGADLALTVYSVTFNGKCFEVLGETRSGASVIVYTTEALQPEKEYYFRIEA